MVKNVISKRRKQKFYEKYVKRVFDVTFASFSFIVLFPFLFLLATIGAIMMKGNPFFCQPRPGKDEKIFNLIKFRTMSNARDKKGELLPDEVRLNAYGKFLRSTSLDELPELWLVVVGKLSLIGPRPQKVFDMCCMTDRQRQRHTVRQGLTGLAQINGRNGIPWEEKLDWDLKYIDNITFLGDMKIFFQTIAKVLKRVDTVREGTVSDMDYGDYLLLKGKMSQEEYQQKLEETGRILSRQSQKRKRGYSNIFKG